MEFQELEGERRGSKVLCTEDHHLYRYSRGTKKDTNVHFLACYLDFNELSEELEEDMSDENENADTNESSDSDDEQDAPELYQDESDDEIQLQPQVRIPTCVVCMDNPPNVVLVPCGHQNLCSPWANQWKD